MIIIDGIRRALYGATTHLRIKQGSVALRGTSYVNLYEETLEYPTQIIALDIKKESSNKAEYRICVGGNKVFPFAASNDVPEGSVGIVPVDVAAGEHLTIEVKGTNPKDSFVLILAELDVIEKH